MWVVWKFHDTVALEVCQVDKMSKANSRRKLDEGSKRSRSSSVGSREKRPSVFDRLGTKARPLTDRHTLCRHDLQLGSCPNCSLPKLSSHILNNSTKKNKKDSKAKLFDEEAALDWSHWDTTGLDSEDEKVLEKRRQLLQRELELQMRSDFTRITRSSSSSSSSSTVSSDNSSSSSLSSNSQVEAELKKLCQASPDFNSLSRSVLKGKRKSDSPTQPDTRKLSPSKLRNQFAIRRSKDNSRTREMGRGRSKQRSASRERRRERSKERHRQRSPRPGHQSSSSRTVSSGGHGAFTTYLSMSSRKKDEDRTRRDESRRERKSDVRDSRTSHYEDSRTGNSSRKERNEYGERSCRESRRDRERHRDSGNKVVSSSASNSSSSRQQLSESSRRTSARSEKDHYSRSSHEASKHYQQMSPSSHHHYRSERNRYGSAERERVTVYKELSPRDSESRVRISSSSAYSEARNSRRRGWESGRYDSPKASREWDVNQPSSERQMVDHREWDRSKHSQEKDYVCSDKEKDLDWKIRSREEDGIPMKRARLDEPLPICEELSDISDEADDILNRDDIDDGIVRGTVDPDGIDCKKDDISSSFSSNIEHRILDQRIADDEGLDSLDFEEISDEELEEDTRMKGDSLGVDWGSLIAECKMVKKKTTEDRSRVWDAGSVLRKIGVSKKYAGEILFNEINEKLKSDGGEGLVSEIGGIQRSVLEATKMSIVNFSGQRALSARMDLALRRQLCGLPILSHETGMLCQFQAV